MKTIDMTTNDEHRNQTSPQDIAAFTIDTTSPGAAKTGLTDGERNDEFFPKPLVKIVNYATGRRGSGNSGTA